MFGPITRLYCGDCLEIMPRLRSQSVDLILTDLPYGTTQNKWDAVIPLEPMWREFRRVCRGPVVLTATQPFSSALVMSNLKEFKYEWIWEKSRPTGGLNSKKQPMRAHESVLVFTGGNYFPQMEIGKANHVSEKPRINSASSNWGKQYEITETKSEYKFPRSVQRFISGDPGSYLHPTQKPVALMEYLIKTYTLPGQWVLDATMGSGTTGVAAKNTGRSFVGIERDPDYFRIASERIHAA